MTSPRLEAALEYGKQGIKIFPCRPGTKFPRVNDPFGNATTDPDIIRGWFERFGDVNIAYCPEDNGRCVADVDMKNGKDGLSAWLALPFEKPVTYTVGTPTGGLHYHYLGSLRQTAAVLGIGIDTRGIRSLALLPPSRTADGEYIEVIPPDCIAPVPEGLVRLAAPREHARLEAPEGIELDAPWNVQRVRDRLMKYVNRGDVAKEGEGGNQRTYQLATEVMDYGISPHLTYELIGELWSPSCEPPWSDDELSTIVENATKYRTNAIGCKALPSPEEMLAGLEQNPTVEATQGRRRFQGYDPVEHSKLPPIEYWDTHRDRRILPKMSAPCSIIVYGPQGSHKSGVVMKELVDACLDRGAKVLYIAAEGALGMGTARLPELMRQRGRPLSDLVGNWITLDAAPDVLDEGDMAELYMEYKEFAPNLVALDTGTRCVGAADINATAVGTQVIKALEQLGRPWNATVLYVTHPGKDEERGAIGSKQQENQGYGVWRVEYDDADLVKVHVEKMKDGLAHFYVPLRVKLGGVPVVYEMAKEERDRLTHGGPTHDELRDAIFGVVWKLVQDEHKVATTNRGYGPNLIKMMLNEAGIDAPEKDIKEALNKLVIRGKLKLDEKGGQYLIGAAAQSPETLQ